MRALRRAALIAALAVLAAGLAPTAPAGAGSGGGFEELWGITYSGLNRSSSPLVADMTGDGVAEVVFGDEEGHLHALRPATGQPIPGWPVQTGSALNSSPALIHIDGSPHVVVGLGSRQVPDQWGGVRIHAANGALRCSYDTLDIGHIWTDTEIPDGLPDPVYATVAVGDITGDGHPEMVFGAFDLHVHAIDQHCRPVPGFPIDVEDSTWSSAALYDMTGDGRMEVFIGSDQFVGGAIDWSGGELRALSWRDGAVVELWKRQVHDVIHSSPAIGDINGDGRLELVVGAGDFYGRPDSRKVFAWHLDDGSDVPGWEGGRELGGVVFSSPVLGDLTGDGRPEVVVAARDGAVYALRGDGTQLWKRVPGPNCCVPAGPINATAVLVDVTGNGRQDVGIGNNWGFYFIDGASGKLLNGGQPLEDGWSYGSSAAVVDVPATGRVIVTVGFSPPQHRTRVLAHRLPTHGTPAWPQWRKRADRIGAPLSGSALYPPGHCRASSNPSPAPSTSSASGYWVLGRDGGVFSFGSAKFHGSLPGRGIAARAAAMAARSDGTGYWVVDDTGAVHAFGAATFHGDMGGQHLNGPIIALEPTPTGEGYWLLGSDGGVFSFGDAGFFGSTGDLVLNAPVISITATPSGQGYWLLGSDGGVFSFGDAGFFGSTGDLVLNAPAISMAAHPSGQGYWLLGADGGVFTFGAARFSGSVPGIGLCTAPTVAQIRSTTSGKGYWLLGSDGGVFTFGDAYFRGAHPGLTGDRAAVDMAVIS